MHPKSTDDVLTLVPSLKIVQHGAEGKGHQILLRGFDAAHGSDVEVRLQGISLNEPSHIHGQGYVDLYGVIPEVISELEMVKGPFLPWQGNFATAGSISLRLGLPAHLRPGVSVLDVGHRGRIRAAVAVAPEGEAEGTFAAMEAVYNRGFGPRRDSRRGALNAGYSLDLGSGGDLSAFVSGQTARFELPGTVRLSDVRDNEIDFFSATDPSGHGLSDRVIGRVGIRRERGGTEIDLVGYGIARQFSITNNFTGYLMNPSLGDAITQQQTAATAGVEATIDQSLGLQFPAAFAVGGGWRFDAIDQQELQVAEDGTPWQVNRDAAVQIHEAHTYAGFRLSPFEWLRVLPSMRLVMVRFDVRDRTMTRAIQASRLGLFPRVALSFPVHSALTFFADYGRGYRAPEARAFLAAGQETVEDESLSRFTGGEPQFAICDTVELGVAVNPIRALGFRVTGFAAWLEHEMVFDHVSNLNLELDNTRRLGVETEITVEPTSWLEVQAAFTYVNARFARSGNPIPGAPAYLASGTVFLGKETGPHGGAHLFWLGERDLAHGASANGYVRLDLDAGWRFRRIDVTFVVDNAVNTKIMEGVYHFASWYDRTEPRSALPQIHYVAGAPVTARLVLTVYL